jgi:PKD repeat protein
MFVTRLICAVIAVGVCLGGLGQEVYYADAHGNRGSFDARNPGRFATPPVPGKMLKTGNLSWNIVYQDVVVNSNLGFDDPVSGATRRACAEAVLLYVNEVLNENSGATIDVLFSLSETDGSGYLAGATTFWFAGVGFNNGFAFDHITTGVDPLNGTVDMEIQFDFGWPWNSDHTAPPGSGQYDLFSVLLHEVTHGLGILSISDENGNGIGGTNPNVYTHWDRLMQYGASTFCWNGVTTALEVPTSAFTSDNLFFSGAIATLAQGSRPRVYAPGRFAPGTSLSHFRTDVDSVMGPFIGSGVAERDYSSIDIGALQDIGYVSAAALPAPVADFAANVTSGAPPLVVSFSDLSSNLPTSWAWDFDNDGTTDSTSKNPTHTYTTPGTYTVKLTASNSAGSGQEIKVGYITVSSPAPVANFTADLTAGHAPLTVTFTDLSSNFPTSWAWDFDNNGTIDSTAQHPSHVYTSPGSYTVTLTATNAAGSGIETKPDYITVTLLDTTISVAPGPWVEEGAEVTFTAGPAGALDYQWYKDSLALGGAVNQTYVIGSAVIADSGRYHCRVTTVAGIADTDPVDLTVFAVGALPAGGWWAVAALAALLWALTTVLVRRRRGIAKF